MTVLYLIRHGEAEGNVYRRCQGVTDGALTELGRMQLAPLSERFASVPLDAVYASDLRRARETAAALAEPNALSVRVLPGLREVNMGVWEDRCWGELARNDPEQYARFNSDPARWSVSGCEHYAETAARLQRTLRQLAAAHPNQTVAAVTHGCAIRILLAELLGCGSAGIDRIPYGDNTCVARLELSEGGAVLRSYNDDSHLPDELSSFRREQWWRSEDYADGRDLWFRPMDLNSESGAEAYLRRYRETWIASHGSDLGFSPVYLEKARGSAARDPQNVLEVLTGDEACGLLELSPGQGAAEGAGHIALLCLDAPYRRQGLGVQLLGQAVSRYRALNRRCLRLRVADTNAAALRFYRRWGFRHTDTEQGSLGEIYIMTRPL